MIIDIRLLSLAEPWCDNMYGDVEDMEDVNVSVTALPGDNQHVALCARSCCCQAPAYMSRLVQYGRHAPTLHSEITSITTSTQNNLIIETKQY